MDRIWSVDGDVSEFSIWRLCRSTKVKSAALESPGNYLDGDN